jgi:hypothetical protein
MVFRRFKLEELFFELENLGFELTEAVITGLNVRQQLVALLVHLLDDVVLPLVEDPKVQN